MSNTTIAREYDALAPDYHWILSDERLTGEPFLEHHRELLESLGPDADILDCACGPGIQAVALARHGYSIRGTDASAEMISEARKRAKHAGVVVPFDTCPWDRLPNTFQPRFDVAFCCGNAIGHCRDEADMLRSLSGIRAVLKENGLLVITSRNWEKLCAEKPRFIVLGGRPRVRNSQRCIVLYVWTFPPRWEQAHTVEVVMILEKDERISCRSHPITYYPFRVTELTQRLETTGFINVETDYDKDNDGYQVKAVAGPR